MDFLLQLAEPWGYLLVFLLAAAEGGALLGLFLPGESVMLLGGVLVFQGRADPALMFAAGCGGSAIGDSVGYWAGRRFGGRLRESRLGRKVGEERWRRAGDYLRHSGGRAVFLGRFLGFLRTLVPPLAGSTRMPYPRFVAFNAPAAVLWAAGFIALGIAAGGSWRLIDRWAGRASLVLLLVLAVALALFLAARWLQGRREWLQARWRAVMEHPRARQLRERFRPQIEFVQRRLHPGQRFGLYSMIGLAAALAAGVAFGAVIDSLEEGGDIAQIDRVLTGFFQTHRSGALDAVMGVIAAAGRVDRVALAILVLGVGAFAATGRRRWLVYTALALPGAVLLDEAVRVVLRVLPLVEGARELAQGPFPSGQTTAVAALAGTIVYLAGSRGAWRAAVWTGAAAAFAVVLIGLSYVYLGQQLPSAALAGLFLGTFWVAVSATTAGQLEEAS
ncbi:MAG: VTT domain-containing protein [Actinomycetota bacterium]|nr:VTT domain-containing protein [Actinomycetota bacterium]